MLNLSFDEILKAVDGEIICNSHASLNYESLSIDSRKISHNSIFIALKGDNFNGNKFLLESINKGAKLCIIDELLFPIESLTHANVILVKDSKIALKKLAQYYRSKLDIKIVGITGSTGKTTTKDILAAFLSGKYKVFKTKGNFNNEIGLPLMILELDYSYEVAVLEMGMNNLNEIHRLAEIAKPDLAIITNVGVSHLENLKTRENILKAKLEITDFFNEDNTLIINLENDMLKTIQCSEHKILKTSITDALGDYYAKNILLNEDSSSFDLYDKNGLIGNLTLSIPGKHNIENAMLAYACAFKLGADHSSIVEGLKNLKYSSMRLEKIKGDRFTILNDAYNASPDSMKAAIEVLDNIEGKRKIAILGTMKELGENSYELHHEVGTYARLKNLDFLITVGEYNEAYRNGFNNSERFTEFSSTEIAKNNIHNYIRPGDVVLVKASRSMEFEKIIEELLKLNN